MSQSWLPLLSLVLSLTLLIPAGRAEASFSEPVEQISPLDDDSVICVSLFVWCNLRGCASYGLGSSAASGLNVCLSDPLPDLPVIPTQSPGKDVTPLTYAQVVWDNAPVYSHPMDAVYGLPPKRQLGTGYIWVSVEGTTTYEGRDYYRINADEYVPADALSVYRPSAFQGVFLAEQPARPFAWILRAALPSLTPGGEANMDAPVYHRYQLVQIFAVEHLGDQVWYLIGPDQWINQTYVGKVALSPVPAGVEPGAAWIDINLFEQTLAAYVGDRMVYATLVSSGLPGWGTPPGLFRVWRKVDVGKMSGEHNKPGYYFLEDVPWTLYYDRNIALHGAYWHDSFGYRHSHGCVNLAPLDAKWLFQWAPEAVWVQVQSGQQLVSN